MIQKSEARASFVKTTAVSCTTRCTLASFRADERGEGSRSPKSPLRQAPAFPGQEAEGALSELLRTILLLETPSSKPMGSEHGQVFLTKRKERGYPQSIVQGQHLDVETVGVSFKVVMR